MVYFSYEITRLGKKRGSRITPLRGQGCQMKVVNYAENGTEDSVEYLTSIIYSFCARHTGHRDRGKLPVKMQFLGQ